MNLLTLEQLTEIVENTKHDLFRIETLPSYDTAMTTGDRRCSPRLASCNSRPATGHWSMAATS
ncbi:MAG: hypothetical protein ACRDRC_05060 [Pseudonocardiaceae bacterium]